MDNRADQAESSAALEQTLRKQAEKIAQEMRDRSSEGSYVVSPEEMRRKHHELLVHQIELEMQNDELRRAQTELEEARSRYMDLYNLAPVGYCTISKKGLILEANLTAANQLDVTRSDLINQPMSRFIFREDQDVYYLKKQQLFETDKPQAYELRMTKRDGTTFWAHVDANTFKDEDGTQKCRAVLSDITERKQADEALRENREMLEEELKGAKLLQGISTELIIEDNLQAIYEKLVDAAKEILESDFASIQMFFPQQGGEGKLKLLAFRGFNKEAADFWKWVDVSSSTACGQALLTGQRVIVQDIEKCDFIQGTKDKDIFLQTGIHACQTTPLLSRNGHLVGMISTQWCDPYEPSERELRLFDILARQAADIIERKNAEDALRESEHKALAIVAELEIADKNKNEFLNALSHELRNPLATIVAGFSLLSLTEDKQQTEKAKEIIQRQIDQLCHLVDDLLDLTRITNNRIILDKERLDLNDLALSILTDFKLLFEEKEMRLEAEINEEDICIDVDPVRIKQIIGNLLNNAMKFTDSGGTVKVSVFREKNEAVICVKDNGIGIDPEFMSKLFVPFEQADISIDRRNGGLGLGLSITKGIAELNGGSVSVYSDGIGKGAQFKIRLPLSIEDSTKDEG